MAVDEKRSSERVTGVSNVAYNLTALFHNKLEAIAALQTYQSDAEAAGDSEVQQLLQQLQQTAQSEVQQIRGLLAQRLGSS
ncbi:MAG: hypothetical protein AVDCRST_MAG49-106 [uncultured Thermomicrobiales bacterium]|uniref:Uncharacterized protein n=1 Tax=uncultured Thermomicrobiales bacterium TaxID=1645740 RepID=A0A6J4TYR5_9BACT|nr:MAG: hypothetical protein AVDCRST_MAG49-106 [uncultured Thermomicrobiales bacterium]